MTTTNIKINLELDLDNVTEEQVEKIVGLVHEGMCLGMHEGDWALMDKLDIPVADITVEQVK